jgi:hypothetical protein
MAERTAAHEPVVHDETHMSEEDFRAQHLATYTRFLWLTKWSVISVAVILALMGLLLT